MNKKLIMLTFLMVLFVLSLFVGGETNSASVEKDSFSAPWVETLDVYFFYGRGCPHCSKVEPFLAEMKQKYNLQVHKYDIYNNRSYLSLFDEYSNMYGLPLGHRGVPTVFVSDTYFVGDTPILNSFEEAVKKALEKSSSVDQALRAEHPERSVQKATSVITGPSIFTVTVAALADSLSPCSIALMVFLIGSRVLVANRRKRMLKVGLAFCLAIFIAYFLFGLGFFTAVQVSGFSGIFGLLVGLLAILAGIFYLKDILWYGKGGFVMEVPRSLKPVLMKMLKGVTSPLGAFMMGFVAVCFELPCTGGPYLFILGQLANSATRLQAIPLLFYYNLLFILPLVMTSLLLYSNLFSIGKVREWTDRNKRLLRFIVGSTMMALGFLTIPVAAMLQFVQLFLGCFRVVGLPMLVIMFLYFAVSFAKHKHLTNGLRGTLLLSMLTAIVIVVPSPSHLPTTCAGVKPYFIYFRTMPAKADINTIGNLDGSIRIAYDTMPVLSADLPLHAVEALQRNPNVIKIEEVQILTIDETMPWGIEKIRADEVWPNGIKGTNVPVAVLDTGIDTDHPDLQANIAWCKSAINYTATCEDDHGHGTHVSGTIAAIDNDIGVIGVAPEAKIYAIKVCNSVGSCPEDAIAKGVEEARKGPDGNVNTPEDRARVISMSLGGPDPLGEAFETQMTNAYSEGIVIVAASGNNRVVCTEIQLYCTICWINEWGEPICECRDWLPCEVDEDCPVKPIEWAACGWNCWDCVSWYRPRCVDDIEYPAKYPEVIAVGATDIDDELMGGNESCTVYPGSQWGPELLIVAPGVSVNSTLWGGGYGTNTGTSMATPHVSGTIALMIQEDPSLTPSEVNNTLCESAVDLGVPGWDKYYGCGRVDAYAAWDAVAWCTSAQECDDGNECTTDDCVGGKCQHTNVDDNTPCTGGICCSGTCALATCSIDTDCDDSNACTIDTCYNGETCSAYCGHQDITECINDDGCCPAGCNVNNDNDCPHVCGDGYCAGSLEGEDCNTCPADCISGGGTCEACWKGVCDGVCNPKKEDSSCADCNPGYCCGDHVCEGNENVNNCLVDCGCKSEADCDDSEQCTTDACNLQTGECGNTWPACGLSDGCCGPTCGHPEDPDCPAAACGDRYCAGEALGEDCSTCPEDCLGKTSGNPKERYCCGNGICEPTGEDANSCPVDCTGSAGGARERLPSPRESEFPLVWTMEIMLIPVAWYVQRKTGKIPLNRKDLESSEKEVFFIDYEC